MDFARLPFMRREHFDARANASAASDIVRRLPAESVAAAGKPSEAAERLANEVQAGDVVLTMGAGDVTLVGPKLLALLEERD